MDIESQKWAVMESFRQKDFLSAQNGQIVRAQLLDSRFLDSLALEWPSARLTQLLNQFSSRVALLIE